MERLNALTGVRGVAAFSLLIAHAIHYSFLYPGNHQLLSDLTFGLGRFGMSLTFLLSGFVIHYNYSNIMRSEGIIYGGYHFMVTRFAKLYPLYILGLIMSLGSIPSPHFDNFWQVISNLTLTQTWFNIEGTVGPSFGQSWTISTEWFFYVLFALFSWALASIRNPFKVLVIFLAITTIFLALIFSLQDSVVHFLTPLLAWKGLPISAPSWYWLTYFSPFIRMFEFIAGVLASKVYLANITRHDYLSGSTVKICLCICVAWCLIAIILHAVLTDFLPNFVFAPAIAPLLILLCRYRTGLSDFLSNRYITFFGEISYSVWVFQFAIMSIFSTSFILTGETWLSPFNAVVKVILIVVLATVFGYGSHLALEVPAQRWLKLKLLTKKQ